MADTKQAPGPKTDGAKAEVGPAAAAPAPAPRPARHVGPFDLMRRFAEEIDRVFDDFGLGYGRPIPRALTRGNELIRREAGLIPAEWSPRVDVRERDGKFCARVDLPGMSKDDIKVEVSDGEITIQGERKHEKAGEREGYSYSECNYGHFYRTIPLPEGVDASAATAEFRDGVLEVTLPSPRRQSPRARRLEIQEKK
jgi:HSP20 family protein